MLTHNNIRLGHHLLQVVYITYEPLNAEQGSVFHNYNHCQAKMQGLRDVALAEGT